MLFVIKRADVLDVLRLLLLKKPILARLLLFVLDWLDFLKKYMLINDFLLVIECFGVWVSLDLDAWLAEVFVFFFFVSFPLLTARLLDLYKLLIAFLMLNVLNAFLVPFVLDFISFLARFKISLWSWIILWSRTSLFLKFSLRMTKEEQELDLGSLFPSEFAETDEHEPDFWSNKLSASVELAKMLSELSMMLLRAVVLDSIGFISLRSPVLDVDRLRFL